MSTKNIDEALKEAELKKLHSEINKIDSDYSKNELEKKEIKSRIDKKWWNVQASGLIQAVIGGAVAGALVAGFGLDHFLKISDLNKKSLEAVESEKDEVEKKASKLEVKSNDLEAEKTENQKRIILLQNELAILKEKSSRIRAEEKRILESKSSSIPISPPVVGPRYITDVWAFGVDESIVEDVKSYLSTKGHEVGFGGLLSSKPSWLALNSTVFYYHKDSEEIAKNIAKELRERTDIKYAVQRGAGLGVMKNEKKVTFFIHVVK